MQQKHDSLDIAIQKTAKEYKGGAKALGHNIGANPGTFTNKCNPKGDHTLTIDEFVAIMEVTGDFRMLDALAELLGYVCIAAEPIKELSDTNVIMSWANWQMQVGEIAKVLATSLEDGKISDDEYDSVRSSMFEEFTLELQLLRLLEQHLLSVDCPLLAELQEKIVAENIEKAIENTINLNLENIAEGLDLRMGNLQRKLDKYDNNMRFNIREIYELMSLTNNHQILFTIASQFGYSCIFIKQQKEDEIDDMELLNIWSACARERGETAESIDQALNCENPDREKIIKICREMFDDFRFGVALLTRLNDIKNTN